MKLLINIEQKCPFIPGVATWQQLTFSESRHELDIFYSNFFLKPRNRRQCNVNTSNFVLKRKIPSQNSRQKMHQYVIYSSKSWIACSLLYG